MARAKSGKKKTTFTLLKKSEQKQIREFSKYIPSLEKYKGKQRLTTAEYGAFKRAKTKLRHTDNLKPVTAKQAKKLKGQLAGEGIRAVRLRNVGDDAHVRVKSVTGDGVIVTTNGRDWEYHPVKPKSAMDLPEELIEKGRELFNRKVHPPWQVHLWTSKGRAGQGYTSFASWARFILKTFNAYHDPQEFMRGVAALVKDGKKNGYRPEIKRKAKAFGDIKLQPPPEEPDNLFYGDYDEEE